MQTLVQSVHAAAAVANDNSAW